MSELRRIKQLEQLYAELPNINCRQQCQKACGPVSMSKLEWARIGRVATGNFRELLPDLTCPLLRDGKCSVYEVRPLICRLFGLVEKMRCPVGCVPERWLSDKEAYEFIGRAARIGR